MDSRSSKHPLTLTRAGVLELMLAGVSSTVYHSGCWRDYRIFSLWDMNHNSLCLFMFFLAPNAPWHHVSDLNVSTGSLNELFVGLVEGKTQVKVIKSFSY